MKNKLSLILLLLFVLNLEGSVLVKGTSRTASFNPDGNPVAKQRGRKRHQRQTQRRAKVHRVITLTPINVMGKPNSATEPAEPATMSEPGAGQEPIVGSSPPTKARPPIDVNKTGAPPAKSAPGIKPPTVQIKPPTR
jgi:hypothetical protein